MLMRNPRRQSRSKKTLSATSTPELPSMSARGLSQECPLIGCLHLSPRESHTEKLTKSTNGEEQSTMILKARTLITSQLSSSVTNCLKALTEQSKWSSSYMKTPKRYKTKSSSTSFSNSTIGDLWAFATSSSCWKR